jgi:hypothetical protein
MVRPNVVTAALAALLPVAALAASATPTAPAARPFEALLPRVATAAAGTYVVGKTALVAVADDARIPLLLQADVLKGPERTARVGIVVGADVSQVADVRLRVLAANPGKDGVRVAADAGASGTPGPLRLVREFSLLPGDYDVEAVIGHTRPGGDLIVAIGRSRLSVPDIQGGALAVTPVVAGEAATTARPANVPFVFGRTTLTPALSPRFRQDRTISVAFRIYNWTAKAEEKPDLTVEYLFYEQGKKGLHFFNKVKPQQLTADTLGTAFDAAAGSVAAGMMIPLGAFTFGDFQLLVKVTDNRNRQSAERRVAFTVSP